MKPTWVIGQNGWGWGLLVQAGMVPFWLCTFNGHGHLMSLLHCPFLSLHPHTFIFLVTIVKVIQQSLVKQLLLCLVVCCTHLECG